MLDWPFLEYLRELNIVSVLVRYSLALLCGGIIGIERELKHRPAGFRTHMLVSVGAATVCILGQYLVSMGYATDVSRLGAQVISGIGFLGAGTIIVTHKQQIKGLTTAAALWASACIGLAVGAGFYEGAIIGTLMIYIIVALLVKVNKRVWRESKHARVYVELSDSSSVGDFVNELKSRDVQVSSVEIEHGFDGINAAFFELVYHEGVTQEYVVKQLEAIDFVMAVEYL